MIYALVCISDALHLRLMESNVRGAERWIAENYDVCRGMNRVVLKCAYIVYERSMHSGIKLDDNYSLMTLIKRLYTDMLHPRILEPEILSQMKISTYSDADLMIDIFAYTRKIQMVMARNMAVTKVSVSPWNI